MTLKEKFSEFTNKEVWEKENKNAEECELIADEYAVEFAEWIDLKGYRRYSNGWGIIFQKGTYSTEELLEIFKKEKGL